MFLNNFASLSNVAVIDSGPGSLKVIATHFSKIIPLDYFKEHLSKKNSPVSLNSLAEVAEDIGMKSTSSSISIEELIRKTWLPCIVEQSTNHFVVIYKITKSFVYVSDPCKGLLKYKKDRFLTILVSSEDKKTVNVLILQPTRYFKEIELTQNSKIGFWFMLEYLRPYRSLVVQLFIGLLFGSLIQLILPFLTQSVVDYGITYQNLHFVVIVLIAQLVLFISQATVEIIRSWILLHITSRININLISDFLLKLTRLPISFFDSKNTGDIFQRIHDHTRIQNFFSTTTLNTLFSVFSVLIFGSVLAYYSLTIFLLFLLGSTLYITWTLLFLKQRAKLDQKRFTQGSDSQNNLLQLVLGMQEIKLSGSEKRRRWEWEAIQIQGFKISIKSLSLGQLQSIGAGFIFQIQNILVTFFTVKSVIDGTLTLGMMISIQYIIGMLTGPINNFITFITMAQDAKISIDRLSEIHSKPDEEPNFPVSALAIRNQTITFEQLNFSYDNSAIKVLDNISLVIPENKVTAIVGASGSGKTTIFKILLRYYLPTGGKIEIDKINLNDISVKEWRRACGTVMQDGYIFNDTIVKNITESDSNSQLDNDRFQKAISIAQLEEFVRELPNRYETKIGSRGHGLSGGQRQRIMIARAIYKNPKYLFFDEATSSLDSETEKKIMAALDEFYLGRTVVIAAHRLSTVKNADQIIVLNKGKIIESGNHSDLLQRNGVYYDLVKNQLDLGN